MLRASRFVTQPVQLQKASTGSEKPCERSCEIGTKTCDRTSHKEKACKFLPRRGGMTECISNLFNS